MSDLTTPPKTFPAIVRAADFRAVTVVHLTPGTTAYLRALPSDQVVRFMLLELAPRLRPNLPGLLQAQGSFDSSPHVSTIRIERRTFHGEPELHLVLVDRDAEQLLAQVHDHPGELDVDAPAWRFRWAWVRALETTCGKRSR